MTVKFQGAAVHQVQFLSAQFPGLDVGLTVPKPRPERFVVVERDGGGASSVVRDRPMVTYKVTAKTIGDAEVLMESVRAVVRAQEAFLNEIGGPVFLPDPDDRLPRYQYTVQLHLRSKEFGFGVGAFGEGGFGW